MISARVVLHSSYLEKEFLTCELTYPRFILPEVNTHRSLSKSTGSSRALPLKRVRQLVRTNPAVPVAWDSNTRFMQAGEPLPLFKRLAAQSVWWFHRQVSLGCHWALGELDLHKQWTSRLLEVHSYTTQVVSGTRQAFEHLLALRYHPDAQPEFQVLAKALAEAIDNSTPTSLIGVNPGWHLPYLSESEWSLSTDLKIKVSIARCARMSYVPLQFKLPVEEAELFVRLSGMNPPHAAPFEHVVQPGSSSRGTIHPGWMTYRELVGKDKWLKSDRS